MHLKKIGIKNFRLLADVDLCLEQQTTLIVGRNNSGKTSLTELFRRLLKETSPVFQLEDFSLSVHEDFWKAFMLKRQNREASDIRKALPIIEIRLTIDYDPSASNVGPLGEFIIDLNPACTQALIIIRYQVGEGEIEKLFGDIDTMLEQPEGLQKVAFFRSIKDRVHERYEATVLAVDPNDPSNQKPLKWAQLRTLIEGGFISAQRGLDDVTHRDRDVLGKVLETLFRTATCETADPKDQEIVHKLEAAVERIQAGIDEGFTKQLEDLLPAFELFGYPGLNDPRLGTETTLDVQRLLTDHTKVHYAGINGINLPEAYNGLGVRNLIFILLKLLEYFKTFAAKDTAPGVHLVFIEEPEVHLHPQMQEVFIGKLNDIASVFARHFEGVPPWPVQFIVTTHSSHLANRASFDSMRYFLSAPDESKGNIRSTQVKDLRQGLNKTADRDFLHKYMTLTRCDLLFADKAILIEGCAERLLLPSMLSKIDRDAAGGPQLSSQYVSTVEVGGAYAHLFFELLEFLELQTLIITDMDSVNSNDNRKACKVSEGNSTSNACIKQWFGSADVSPDVLVHKAENDKICGVRRLAYQVPEHDDGACGRSFEDAFMLANPSLFGLAASPRLQQETDAWEKARAVECKADFALEYAIKNTEWTVPKYIGEGLRWLRSGALGPTAAPAMTTLVSSVTVGQAQGGPDAR